MVVSRLNNCKRGVSINKQSKSFEEEKCVQVFCLGSAIKTAVGNRTFLLAQGGSLGSMILPDGEPVRRSGLLTG